jgi:hypothetical protein
MPCRISVFGILSRSAQMIQEAGIAPEMPMAPDTMRFACSSPGPMTLTAVWVCPVRELTGSAVISRQIARTFLKRSCPNGLESDFYGEVFFRLFGSGQSGPGGNL